MQHMAGKMTLAGARTWFLAPWQSQNSQTCAHEYCTVDGRPAQAGTFSLLIYFGDQHPDMHTQVCQCRCILSYKGGMQLPVATVELIAAGKAAADSAACLGSSGGFFAALSDRVDARHGGTQRGTCSSFFRSLQAYSRAWSIQAPPRQLEAGNALIRLTPCQRWLYKQ